MDNSTNISSNSINLTNLFTNPSNWFSLPARILLQTDNGSIVPYWPWLYLTVEQWSYLHNQANSLTIATAIYAASVCNYVCFAFCLIGTFFTILIIRSKISAEKCASSFHVVMIAVAILDLIFMSAEFYGTVLESFGFYQDRIHRVIFNIFYAVGFSCSCMSDMLTLCLTIERCAMIAFPLQHKKHMTPERVRLTWVIMIIVSVLISCTRLHYAIDNVPNMTHSGDQIILPVWLRGVAFFSDTVVPLALTVIMICCSALIIRAIRNRKNKVISCIIKNGRDDSSSSTDEAIRSISLLSALLVMFFMNQIGYILYSCGQLIFVYFTDLLNFSSDFAEVKNYVNAQLFYFASALVSAEAENISRSFLFYVYLAFNHGFRRDFMSLIKFGK